MKKTELLLPAGSIEKMKYAIQYGADAIYLGIKDYSLRTLRSGDIITSQNIGEAIDLAHNIGAKVYTTFNIFAKNSDIETLKRSLSLLKETPPDGIIFADPGVLNVIKKHLPETPLHVSTQANTLNYEAVKFWQDLGATRIILARELPLTEIAKIHKKVPDIELESLVHGSQCVSYSGRCLISDFMTHHERKANEGKCAQACRWKYNLIEQTRPNEIYQIEENQHGSFILSPKDLALIQYLPQLIDAGVSSFKIEGRTKSTYYAAAVAKTYRKALDMINDGQKVIPDELFEELKKVGNRGYTKGFLLGEIEDGEYNYENSKGRAGENILGLIEHKKDGYFFVTMKNKIFKGDTIEMLTPTNNYILKIDDIKDIYDEKQELANTNKEVYFKFDKDVEFEEYAMLRTYSKEAVKGV